MKTDLKYPRTLHAPWSPGATSDDKVHTDMDYFNNKRVVVTLKMDGENSTLTPERCYARSIDSRDHPSRHWLKLFHATIRSNLDADEFICGENLFAQHSIHYDDLESYFVGFSLWQKIDETAMCVDWDSTIKRFDELDVQPVEVIYDGIFNEKLIKNAFEPFANAHEGYVIRIAESFPREDFAKCVAKFVRKNHVQTDEHWMYKSIIKNKLKEPT